MAWAVRVAHPTFAHRDGWCVAVIAGSIGHFFSLESFFEIPTYYFRLGTLSHIVFELIPTMEFVFPASCLVFFSSLFGIIQRFVGIFQAVWYLPPSLA